MTWLHAPCDTGTCVDVAFVTASGANGNCVEVAYVTASAGNGACVEAGQCDDPSCPDREMVLIRDSKDPNGPRLRFNAEEWRVFYAGMQESAGVFKHIGR